MKNKKGYTLVEVIVSFVLIMIVMIYLLRTIVVLINKNNDLLAYQEYSVYESSLLKNVYKDVDVAYDMDEIQSNAVVGNGNVISLKDINKQITIDEANRKIIYDNTVYELPDNVNFRKEDDKLYKIDELNTIHKVYVITIYLKVNRNDEDLKIVYQNKKLQDYAITFDANGGKITSNPDHGTISGDKLSVTGGWGREISIPTASRVGYGFIEWYLNGDLKLQTNKLTLIEFQDYIAKWSANTYSISYDLDGGNYGTNHPTTATYDKSFTVNNPSKSVTAKFKNDAGATLSSSADITKSYTFNGWNITGMDSVTHTYGSKTTTQTSLTGVKDTTFKNLRSTSGTVNFLAKWTPPTITLPKITKTGYTCVWTSSGISDTKSEGTYSPATTGGATSRTFNTKCSACTYTVKYNANGGTGTMSDSTHTYDTAKALTANGFSKTGHTFAGWAKSSGGSVEYSDKQSVKNLTTTCNGTVNLYAKWNAKSVVVTFNSNGATSGKNDQTQTFTYGVANQKFSAKGLEKTGYTLQGWGDSNNNVKNYDTLSGVSDSWINSNSPKKTIYAAWKANTFTVEYNANGGTGTTSSHNCTYDSACTLKANGFTKTGHTFTGWKKGNTGGLLSANTSIKNIVTNGTVTYYAQWAPKTVEVTFNSNGATSGTNNQKQTFTYGVANQKFSAKGLSKTGHKLLGWGDSNNNVKNYDTLSGVSDSWINSNSPKKTIYAAWEKEKYYLDLNGLLDGTSSGNIDGYGTADVYIDGKLVCDNCKDYYVQHPYGTSYEIKDIKANNGRTYNGVSSGSIKGTIPAANTKVQLKFTSNKIKITLNKNGGSGGDTYFWYYYGTSTFYGDQACTRVITSIVRPTRNGYNYVDYRGDGTSGGGNGERYVEYDNVHFASDLATDIYKDATLTATWSIRSFSLDLNGLLDGTSSGNISGYGTADVYIDGSLKCNDCTDYYVQHPYGTKYEIKDIKRNTGKTYNGVSSGSASGTIPASNVVVQLKYTTNKVRIRFDMNGGSLASSHGSNVSTVGSYITIDKSNIVHEIQYGKSIGTDGLKNYDNSGHVNITKTGHIAKSGAEWKTSSKTYNQTSNYAASDFCNASNGDCYVTLYVNWTPRTYTITYKSEAQATQTQTATYGANMPIPPKPAAKSCKRFLGWVEYGSNFYPKSYRDRYSFDATLKSYNDEQIRQHFVNYGRAEGRWSGDRHWNCGSSYCRKYYRTSNLELHADWGDDPNCGISSAISTLSETLKPVYTVTYKADCSGNADYSEEITKGEDYYIWPNWFSCSGYTFSHWWGDDGHIWYPGNTWTYTYDKNVTLYAKWTANSASDTSSGKGSSGSTSCTWKKTSSSCTYRTDSDTSCTGSKNQDGGRCYGSGTISSTANGQWFCKGTLYKCN